MTREMISVAAGGAIGAASRYLLLGWLGGVDEGWLPWGTVVANILGSFMLGLVAGLTLRGAFSEGVRLFLAVGLLGGFTTFSLFSYQNLELLRGGRELALLLNVAGQVVIGLGAAIAGFALARVPRSTERNR